MSVRKHILIICPFASPNVGGVESHLDKLVYVATKKDFYITLITYQPLTQNIKALKFEKKKNFEIYRVDWPGNNIFPVVEQYYPLSFAYLFPGMFVKSVLYYLKNHKDIHCIHAHGLAAATVARFLDLIYPKRTVLSTHAVYEFGRRLSLAFFVRIILRGFDKILAVSKVAQKELIALGLSREKVGVHINWINTRKFKPLKKHAKKNLRLGAGLNCLFVGRFIELKGVTLILKVAKKLPKITFHFVGSGPLEAKVHQASESCKNVVYHGVLKQSDKKEFKKLLNLYSSCDYTLSPYLYDEGFSTTLVESIACGTPVVITDRGSPPTFLNEDVAVFLPRDFTISKLRRILKGLSKKDAAMVKKCRKFALENFGPKNAKIVLDSYE